jgi:hypothetical protein
MSAIQMSDLSTAGNRTHQANLLASEATRQAAAAAATTQAAMRTADIAHYRTCLASAIANNCSTNTFVNALKELGTGGS